mgnify:CR=1 FL=1
MSDMQSMDREKKKKAAQTEYRTDAGQRIGRPMDGGRLAKYKRKKRIIAAAAVCFLAALGFTGYRYMNEYEYTGYSVQWERSMRYTENSGADKKTQAAETSAAADSAGTDGAGETASAESSGASGREAEPQMRRVRGNFCTGRSVKTVGE